MKRTNKNAKCCKILHLMQNPCNWSSCRHFLFLFSSSFYFIEFIWCATIDCWFIRLLWLTMKMCFVFMLLVAPFFISIINVEFIYKILFTQWQSRWWKWYFFNGISVAYDTLYKMNYFYCILPATVSCLMISFNKSKSHRLCLLYLNAFYVLLVRI